MAHDPPHHPERPRQDQGQSSRHRPSAKCAVVPGRVVHQPHHHRSQVLLPLLRGNDRPSFERLATDVLFEQFKFTGTLNIKIFEKLAESVTLLTTNNRNLTGTMNRMAFEAQFFDDDFDRLNDSINGFLDYASPREAFAKAVASIDRGRY